MKLRIGEIASQAGVTPRVIRYYETLGLLGPISRSGGRYRQYTDETVDRLRKIGVLKQLGLSLDEIRGLLEMYFEDSTRVTARKKLLEILSAQLSETDAKIASLTQFRSDLHAMITRVQQRLECSVRET